MNIKSIVFTIFVFLVIAGALLYYFLATPSFVVKEGPPKVIAVLIASDLQLSSVEGVKAGLKELNYQIDKDVIIKLNNPKGLNFGGLLTEITDNGKEQTALDLFKQLNAEMDRDTQSKTMDEIVSLTVR